MLMLLFLLPLMVPPITYGIPLATVLYKLQLAGTIYGVILANLIPAAPFVILVMTPFIEQIDPNLESAARVFGAGTGRMFWHILVPLLGPGILAASLLVLVRTIALFELTFLTAGPDSQTLVVALYYAVFAAGVRAPQSVDAMAMVYMLVTLAWLLIALRFVNPTQLVSRVKGILSQRHEAQGEGPREAGIDRRPNCRWRSTRCARIPPIGYKETERVNHPASPVAPREASGSTGNCESRQEADTQTMASHRAYKEAEHENAIAGDTC
jgi:ABC-type molybdate transport system permease subunit